VVSCGERRSRVAEKLKRRVSFRVISSERSWTLLTTGPCHVIQFFLKRAKKTYFILVV
jgi:hypothetical protein